MSATTAVHPQCRQPRLLARHAGRPAGDGRGEAAARRWCVGRRPADERVADQGDVEHQRRREGTHQLAGQHAGEHRRRWRSHQSDEDRDADPARRGPWGGERDRDRHDHRHDRRRRPREQRGARHQHQHRHRLRGAGLHRGRQDLGARQDRADRHLSLTATAAYRTWPCDTWLHSVIKKGQHGPIVLIAAQMNSSAANNRKGR